MLSVAALVGLPACSGVAGAEPDASAAECRAVFTLTVSDTGAGTSGSRMRAPGYLGDGYDTGSGFENYIDVAGGNFRFYFFDAEGVFISPVAVESVLPTESTSTSRSYAVDAVCDPAIAGRDLRVVVLANWPAYPAESALIAGSTTIGHFWEYIYEFSAENMRLSETATIPLFGVSSLRTLRFDALNRAEIGTVHMLRAYAKVQVIPSTDSVFPIEWVKLHRYNTRGYCAPGGVSDESDYVHYSYDKDYVSAPSVPDASESDADLEFMPSADGSWIAYVPEYLNKGRAESEKCSLRIRFSDPGEDSDYEYDTVHFKNYDSSGAAGESFDVLRNTWYKFTVKKKASPTVQIVPYNEVDLFPLFGLLIHKDLVPVFEPDGSVRYYYNPETGQYYGPDGQTEIEDPYLTVDPVTGYTIIRDMNDAVIAYYDPATGKYYDPQDKTTEIPAPR